MRCDRSEENVSVTNDGTSSRYPHGEQEAGPATILLSSWRSQLTEDSWQLSEDLRHAQRLVAEVRNAGLSTSAVEQTPLLQPEQADANPKTAVIAPVSSWLKICWMSVCLSAIACLGGMVLLCWAEWADRSELWRYGWPLMLAGQTGVIVSLLLLIESRWRMQCAWQSQESELPASQSAEHRAPWWKTSTPAR